jgi:hypothetical protein
VEVVFADGLTVKCTPDHLFLTDSGWRYAENLMPDTAIQSCLMRSHNGLMGAFSNAGRAAPITPERAVDCIGWHGKVLLEQFRKAVISITKMATQTITPWPISNACQPINISVTLGAKIEVVGLLDGISAKLREPKLRSGMLPKRGIYGISDKPVVLKAGQNGSANRQGALNAAIDLVRLFASRLLRKFIAVKPVKPLRIANVRKLNERQDVWCLTVPDVGCFSLANGAIVHNSHASDAFGLMCVAYDEPRSRKYRPAYDSQRSWLSI